jgi:hypothetical protein
VWFGSVCAVCCVFLCLFFVIVYWWFCKTGFLDQIFTESLLKTE